MKIKYSLTLNKKNVTLIFIDKLEIFLQGKIFMNHNILCLRVQFVTYFLEIIAYKKRYI